MTCTKCGALLEAGSVFCSHCGTRVAVMSDAPQGGARATSARPLGTVLIAVLTLLIGLMDSLVACSFVLTASFEGDIGLGLGETRLGGLLRTRPEFTVEFTVISFIVLLMYAYYMLGVLQLVASYGLFTLQSWALRLTTILWAITAVVGILGMLLVQTPGMVVSGLFYLGAAALIYGYFGKPEIRSLYGN
jgi:hypothetical protein